MPQQIAVKELNNGVNVRSVVDTTGLESIELLGILIPLQVYSLAGQWFVKEGHRRLAKALELGLEIVPCDPVDAPADAADEIEQQMLINSTQSPLSYLDRANGWKALKQAGRSQREIAQKFQVSDAEVSLAIQATTAHPALQEALNQGRIKPSAIEPLLPLSQELQGELAPAAIRAKTVTKVRALVNIKKAELGLGRGSKPVKEVQIAEDMDPLDLLRLSSLQEALEILGTVDPISHPDVRDQARATVKELLATACRLAAELGKEPEVTNG